MSTNIGIYTKRVECITYTIAQAVASTGNCVYVITSPKELNQKFYYSRIEQIKNVKISNELEVIDFDDLYIENLPSLSRNEFLRCAKISPKISIIAYHHNFSYMKTLLQEIKHSIKYFPGILKVRRIYFIDNYYDLDIFRLWSNKYFLGFDVHSNFWVNKDLKNALFDFRWEAEKRRIYKLNFIGNRNPAQRKQIIESVKNHLKNSLFENQILWIEYGDDPGEKRGVLAREYMNYLSESDFTLCPPGYAKITHRVIEALVRGSIPILHKEELRLYDMNLENNLNCIAVHNRDWIGAIKRAMSLNQSKIIQMRYNILSMKDDYLAAESFSRRLIKKMGIN